MKTSKQPTDTRRHAWLVVRLRGRCLRVVKRPNIWVDREFFYPEERPKWWPFWFRFADGCGGQVFFREEPEAWEFLQRVFPHNVLGHAAAGESPEKQEPTASPSDAPSCWLSSSS